MTSIYKKRRDKFIQELSDNSIVLISNNKICTRSNDVEYRFRTDSDFYYLTGFDEPNACCILKKEKRKNYSYFLFIEVQSKDKEIWNSKRIGLEKAKYFFKADKTFSILDLENEFKKHLQDTENIFYSLGKDKELDTKIITIINENRKSIRSGLKTSSTIFDPRDIIHKMRLYKDNYEVNCIQKAAIISKEAHIKAMQLAKAGIFEYELEGLLEFTFKKHGGIGPAYPSIVGSGSNSTILHYIKNSRKIQKNDLILIDAGCEYNYYASDVTRTFPASKKFSPAQKDLYEIVLEAQKKAIEQIKPQKRFNDSYDKALSIIIDGLKELKLLTGSKEKIIKKKLYRKFFMHKLSHWLGLDVHDAGPYIDKNGKSIKLQPNMVLTVEPGIYISSDCKDVPKQYRGIGIRIEDDILITKTGNRILTEGIPKKISEIEKFAE